MLKAYQRMEISMPLKMAPCTVYDEPGESFYQDISEVLSQVQLKPDGLQLKLPKTCVQAQCTRANV